MTRWRPPSPKSSLHITAAGLDRLRAELRQLWTTRREVVAALSAAAAEGDRSENAEYIYRKKQLREIDRRIRYLDRRIGEVRPVRGAPADTGRVYFGAWVEVVEHDGRCFRYRIVGADEIDAGRGWISVDSPLARALLGRAADDVIELRAPGGVRVLEIVDIRYGDVDDD